ncbi:MAG: glycogen synthase GlgA [Myxococcales bacterium]|nr:glycogen synthase GlgA [Myxococcales bacterium]
MDILFVSSEVAPYVKVGGLADVAAALPKALKSLGHKVTVVAPRYPGFEEAGLMLARRLTPLAFDLGGKRYEATVFDVRLPSQVDLALIDVPGLFDRAGVYGERGEDYPDNALRFAVFSRAVVELAKLRAEGGAPYDVLHANDWTSALACRYAEEHLPAGPRTVLTIHNIAHQGVFPKAALGEIGLTAKDFTLDGIEFYGGINVLKQGIRSAGLVTTVSATYAKEIQTESGGAKLHGVLASKPRVLGILNGVDYGVWNPATDSVIATRYDAEDASGKARCKDALQRELGLPTDTGGPVVAYVGRMVEQKGVDLVAECIPKILRGSEAQVVVAGGGEPGLVAAVRGAVEKSHGRAVLCEDAAEALVHRIFAGADILLVPSRFEPCGLVQMYAQRYGALPVAHAVGGLVDTIVDCDAKLETGTGFLFDEPTGAALLGATQRAIAAYQDARWPSLRRRVMRLDLAWDRAARQYEAAYKSLSK